MIAGRDEVSAGGGFGRRALRHREAASAHRLDIRLDRVARLGRDDRADVRRQAPRIAGFELRHRALEHREHGVRDVRLQAEDAQGRAALAGGIEGRRHHVGRHLLRKGGGIDDHRVDAARLGDQRHGRAARGQPAGELPFDETRDRRRAGEDHALDAGVVDDRRADLARARQERERVGRDAGGVQDADRLGRDQRRLLGGLGDDRIAGGEGRCDLSGEDREGKVPRADAGDDPERTRAGGDDADGLDARSSAGSRPPPAPPRRRWRRVLPASRTMSPIRSSVPASNASAARRRTPRARSAVQPPRLARPARRRRSRRKPRRGAPSGRIRRRPSDRPGSAPVRPARPPRPRVERRGATARALASSPSASVASRRSSLRSSPRAFSRSAP